MRVYVKVESYCTPPGCCSQSPWGWPSRLGHPRNQFISIKLEKLDKKHIYYVKLNKFFFYLVSFIRMSFLPSMEGSRMENITFLQLVQVVPQVVRAVSKFNWNLLYFKAICNLSQILYKICHCWTSPFLFSHSLGKECM